MKEYKTYLEETLNDNKNWFSEEFDLEELFSKICSAYEKEDQSEIIDDPFVFIYGGVEDPINRLSNCTDSERGYDYDLAMDAYKLGSNFYAVVLYDDNRMFFVDEIGRYIGTKELGKTLINI